MIARMSKYDFVLFAAQSDDFIGRLRELGLVDITTRGWEPSEGDRQLIADIEGSAKALDSLAAWRAEHPDMNGESYASGREAYEAYADAQRDITALRSEIARLDKMAEELRPWGEFDPARLQALASQGVTLRYFVALAGTYDKNVAEWSATHTLAEINRNEASVWFVAVSEQGGDMMFDAQEVKAPAADYRAVEGQIAARQAEIGARDAVMARVAASEELLADYAGLLRERMQNVKIESTAGQAADGKLLVLEGWAEKATSAAVDALLEEYPNVLYIKSDPTPDDDTPVKLINNRFARIFELVGDMYARPKYGTLDLTPFFAPFYMLFFGICLNDAGYGLVLLALGLGLLWKNREPGMMNRAAWFATMCAIATILFGGFGGSFFGMSMGAWFPNVEFYDFQGKFFSMALAIGMLQIMFGLAINTVMTARIFGISHCLASLGWLLILIAGSLAAGLPMINEAWAVPGLTTSSPVFYGLVGLGAVLMMFFNTPGKFHNPLLNFASGLWNLYNNITGLLSDVLSYIRLFAIGLSGGVLALVFNSLAEGFVPEGAGIVTRILVMLPILLIGHGINLFMSTISSFVHPMRLTFVEFYKNAGFEMASRAFDPLRKLQKTK